MRGAILSCLLMLAATAQAEQVWRITITINIEKLDAPKPDTPKPEEKPSPKADALAALCKLSVGTTGCTATIIGPRRADGRWDVLTANHCIPAVPRKGVITLKDGRKLAVTSYEREASSDLCWMVTDEKHDSLPFALLAEKIPEAGTKIWHAGYGVDRPGNVERGEVIGAETPQRQLQMKLNVSPGDSGGGIFREDTNELVSAVCCTRAIGRLTTMFGGSSVRANELRRKPDKAAERGKYEHPTRDLKIDPWNKEKP